MIQLVEQKTRFAISFGLLYVLSIFALHISKYNLGWMYFILSGVIVLGISMYYFRGATSTLKDGLLLALSYMILGAIVDGVLILLSYMSDPANIGTITNLYKTGMTYLILLEMFVICALVGHLMSNPDS